MGTQKSTLIETVKEARRHGRRVGEVLATLRINRATYYRWKQGRGAGSPTGVGLTPGGTAADRRGESGLS